MKQKFSPKWIGSKQPRKQIKYRANAPLHIRHKMMSVNFSKELRKKHGKRNFPIRKGDSVRIMKGEFKNKTGKIDDVDLKKMRIVIDGIYRTKKDGAKVNVYFNASNLQVKELNLEDVRRKKALDRKGGVKVEGKKDEDKKDDKKDADKKEKDEKKEKKTEDKNVNKNKEDKK